MPNAVDKRPFVSMIRRMSNTEKQEAIVDESNSNEARLLFADKAEKLLRAILVALGYENAGTLRGEDLIAGITAWVTLLITMKREPGGSYASFWARAFLDAWKDMPSGDAAEAATAAVNEFAKRYPPMLDDALIDEQERDTQTNIQVLTAELDKQVQLVWQLEAENKSLLKANEHHASELARIRLEFDTFADNVRKALNVGSGVDLIAIIEARTRTHREYHELKANALVPLAKPERVEPGQRWAFVMTSVPPFDIPGTYYFRDAYGEESYVADRVDIEAAHYLGTGKV